MDKGEGAKLRDYLKKNKFNQEDLAIAMGYTGRHSLIYHFDKDILDYELKMNLRKNGVKLFDENGKIHLTSEVNEPPAQYGNAKPIDLGDKLIMQVPLVSQHAYAGYLTGFADEEYVEQLSTVPFVVDKEPRGKYFAFEVGGDSMDNGTSDSYLPGDILLCREIKRELWQSKLHIKKYDFVVVHKSLGVQIKQISKHDTAKGILTLHPLNTDYDDKDVSLNDVKQICNVVQVMRKK